MTPREIRDHVGHEHLQIRILFAEVEGACRETLDRGRGDPRMLILKLVGVVSDHLTMEDRLLIPSLREVGWGAAAADRVATEHAAQRKQLAELKSLARHGSVETAARAALELIAVLIADMNVEEAELLNRDRLAR
jgi:hypothetical protein